MLKCARGFLQEYFKNFICLNNYYTGIYEKQTKTGIPKSLFRLDFFQKFPTINIG